MRYVFIIMAVMLAAACQPKETPGKCRVDETFYTVPDMASCPGDIQAWMDRAFGCGHFAGEEAYDEERRAYIEKQVKDLSCNTLGCDYKTLFAKYEGDVVYAGLLGGFAAATFGDADSLPLCLHKGE